MSDDVTLLRHLSLAGRFHEVIPERELQTLKDNYDEDDDDDDDDDDEEEEEEEEEEDCVADLSEILF